MDEQDSNYFLGLYALPDIDLLARDGEAQSLIGYLDGVLAEYDGLRDRVVRLDLQWRKTSQLLYTGPLVDELSVLRESIEPKTHMPYKELITRRDALRAKVSR